MINNTDLEYVNCNLCNSDDTKLLYIKNGFNIVQCKKCGLIYVNPRHTFHALNEIYTKGYYSGQVYEDYIGGEKELKTMFRKRLKRIEKYKKGGRLLDIGCALGFFLEVAKENEWDAFGVEFSEYASNYASGRGLKVFRGGLTETKFPDEYFDVITMWDVIANLTDPYSNLIEANRILKKNGLITISTGNINSVFAKLKGIDWALLTPEGHLYYFSPETLRKMLEVTGFKILSVTHGTLTGSGRIRRLPGYTFINWVLIKKLKFGDYITVYALKI